MSSFSVITGDHGYHCDPCKTVGEHAIAKGFCTNCEDYLCEICFKCHSRSKTSRHHALLDKYNMPRKSGKSFYSTDATGSGLEAYPGERENHLYCNSFKVPRKVQALGENVPIEQDKLFRGVVHSLETSVHKLDICDGDDYKTHKEKYIFLRNINVKVPGDDRDCYIAEMTLVSTNELLLSDYNNKSLKLLDVIEDTVKAVYRLQSPPIGITTISKDQVAVVLENEWKIQILSVSGGIFVVRTLNTHGNCVDIKYINGKLYASFWEPVKFQILQTTGVIYRTIRPHPEVLKYCILPSYIEVSHDESMLYVSDWKTKNVLCIDMYGNMISMYQSELKGPADIAVSPFGAVYLCDREQHIVYRMTQNLTEAKVILKDKREESTPHAMCFNEDLHHLYISSGSTEPKIKNNIKIYRWK